MHGRQRRADFQALQNAFDGARTADIVYYLFDVPLLRRLRPARVPLVERRALLQRVLQGKPPDEVRFSEAFDAPTPRQLVARACQTGLGGRDRQAQSRAYASRRSTDWIKLKCSQRQEFVIGGYTDPKGSRTGIGSLLLGVHDDAGQAALRRQRGHRLQRANAARPEGASWRRCRPMRARSPIRDEIARRRTGSSPSWWPRCAFGEWTRTAVSATRCSMACAPTSRPSAIVREEPRHMAAVQKPERARCETRRHPAKDTGATLRQAARHATPTG